MAGLSPQQKDALRVGRCDRWLGTRECGTMGSTMTALARRGLAEVRLERPGGRFLYRLTPTGMHRQRLLGGSGDRAA